MLAAAPWDPGNPVHAYSPLGKLPVLILDDGTHLYDSRVIVEYIDLVSPVSRLIPEPARQRIAVKKWEALADGVRRTCKATNGSIANAARSAKASPNCRASSAIARGVTARVTRWRTSQRV